MLIVIFRSRRADGFDAEYAADSERMERLVETMPGFVSFKSFLAPDGERVSIGEFESLADLERWRDHPEHVAAQERGRLWYYGEYRVSVCDTIRDYSFCNSLREQH